MAYNPYGGPHGGPPGGPPYGAPQYNGYGYPAVPPGMSSAPGMAPPPGVVPPHGAPQANRPSGLPASFQPPPNIDFNAPVIRLGGASGPISHSHSHSQNNGRAGSPGAGVPGAPTGPAGYGASSLPARPNLPQANGNGNGYGGPARRDAGPGPDGHGPRGDYRGERFDGRYDNRYEPRGERYERYDRDRDRDRDRNGNGNDRGPDRPDRPDRGDRGPERHHNDRDHSRSERERPAERSGATNLDQQRAAVRETMSATVPQTNDEKLRTIFVHKVPDGVGGEAGLERVLAAAGRLRRFDCSTSRLADHKGTLFAFAQYEDLDALASALALLEGVKVPLQKQPRAGEEAEHESAEHESAEHESAENTENANAEHANGEDEDDRYKGIRTTTLQVAVDPVSREYVAAHEAKQSDEARKAARARYDAARVAFDRAVHELFFPPAVRADEPASDGQATVEAVLPTPPEVVHIPLSGQDDELADVPEEMRAMVAQEIASFRDRSTQRDLERLRREQEMEEQDRRRTGDDAASASKAKAAALALARERERPRRFREDPDTDASDEELWEREVRRQAADDARKYADAERKWSNRERQRAAALERETEREQSEAARAVRVRDEMLSRDRAWDDEREAARATVLYYRDHAAWQRKRARERADEEARDEADRRAEAEELRKEAEAREAAQGQADSALAKQAAEMEAERAAAEAKAAEEAAAAAAPAKVTISFGAAAQRNQAQRAAAAAAAATRRTVAEVEGLLDDEEADATSTRRALVPIAFEPMSAAARMSDAELNQAVRSLAQEIPTERDGLWAWPVAWSYLDEGDIVRDKLRPFVEKKVVEYLGVQEQFLVEVVEAHLRAHGGPQALVEELQEALDDAAEDLVRKLWRMVIFFTESEKRGLPA